MGPEYNSTIAFSDVQKRMMPALVKTAAGAVMGSRGQLKASVQQTETDPKTGIITSQKVDLKPIKREQPEPPRQELPTTITLGLGSSANNQPQSAPVTIGVSTGGPSNQSAPASQPSSLNISSGGFQVSVQTNANNQSGGGTPDSSFRAGGHNKVV